MERRTFIRSIGGAGASFVLGGTAASTARAVAPSHSTPLFVTASLLGGYDVSIFCDPKSGPDFPINNFSAKDYQQFGPFTLAPGSIAAVQFFKRYYKQIMLLNGVYAETNSHGTGVNLAASGDGSPDMPVFAALAATCLGPELGLTFVSSGGDDQTGHQVARTLVNSGLPTAMASVTGQVPAFTGADSQTISTAVAARLARKQALATFALPQKNMQLLSQARQGWASFPGVLKTLTDVQTNVPLVQGVTGDPGASIDMNNSMFLAIQVGLAGYVNGATISLNIGFGNCDQHSLFAGHHLQIDSFFVGLDYLWRAAAYLGIADRIMLMAGSDFSRTPFNIAGAGDTGKGHWQNTTSILLMGAHVPGATLIGQSTNDATFQALALDSKTLKPAASGTMLLRAHVHHELRRVAGILDHPIVKNYPLTLPGGPVTILS